MPTKQIDDNKRPIVSRYYENIRATRIVKTTRSLHANSAVINATNHMQLNHYGARLVEVYDERDGKPHASIVLHANGNLEIIFKREVKEGM
jgi:hypothetical protein